MRKRNIGSFASGTAVGVLGGLVGLGGAEFRLPILISGFRFSTLDAVMLNKMTSLIVVACSIPFRSAAVPWDNLFAYWPVALNLLAGSLAGAWLGAQFAVLCSNKLLNRMIVVLLILLALAMLLGHEYSESSTALMEAGLARILTGIAAGIAIGFVAAVLGVAGGELIIPTLVLLYGLDVKTAGSLSLCISLPTMLVAFARYSKSGALQLLNTEKTFVLFMALGSICGAAVGASLVGLVPHSVLVTGLGLILLLSAAKIYMHTRSRPKLLHTQTNDGRVTK